MERRLPRVAGLFYPARRAECEAEIADCLERAAPPSPGRARALGGVVPHAGWVFSGSTMASTLRYLAEHAHPTLLVLLGAVHSYGVGGPTLFGPGVWETPLGPVPVDGEASALLARHFGPALREDPRAHADEHSIEVMLPFVRYMFPSASIVPIAFPPTDDAPSVGQQLGALIAQGKLTSAGEVAVVASTDLTHYGPRFGFTPAGLGPAALAWVRESNDRRIIEEACQLRAEEIVPEARSHQNACGAGALAAAVAAARAQGVGQGSLLRYTTSADEQPDQDTANFVGYASIVFAEPGHAGSA